MRNFSNHIHISLYLNLTFEYHWTGLWPSLLANIDWICAWIYWQKLIGLMTDSVGKHRSGLWLILLANIDPFYDWILRKLIRLITGSVGKNDRAYDWVCWQTSIIFITESVGKHRSDLWLGLYVNIDRSFICVYKQTLVEYMADAIHKFWSGLRLSLSGNIGPVYALVYIQTDICMRLQTFRWNVASILADVS